MSLIGWSFEVVEDWVNTALLNLGYQSEQAAHAASSVIWLQQRHAPGVAAIAQHMDFISAYKITPKENGDAHAQCPVVLSASLQSLSNIPAQTFENVRQPLLLIPTLAKIGGVLRWDNFETELSQAPLNIEYERKTLRNVLVPKVDVFWEPRNSGHNLGHDLGHDSGDTPTDAPSNRHLSLATEILPRELVYVKTVQHYAGTLPPPEPLDPLDEADNTSSAL